MRFVGITISAALLLSASLANAANKPVDHSQYRRSSSTATPHHTTGQKSGIVKSGRRSTVVPNTVTGHGTRGGYNAEVARLERDTTRVQTRSQHNVQRSSRQASMTHSDASARSSSASTSGINFSYRAPHAGGTGHPAGRRY